MNRLLNPGRASPLPRKISLGIRGKVTLPYLILSLAVALVGVFIVTYFVVDSLEERFTNQLTEAGRVAADGFVRIERGHLDLWRVLAATQGLPEAMRSGESSKIRDLILGAAASRSADSVWVIDRSIVRVALDRMPVSGEYAETFNAPIPDWEPLNRVLRGERDQFGDKFSGLVVLTGQPYIFTVGPVKQGSTLVGAVIVGTRLHNALRQIDEQAVASVSAYDLTGNLLDSTLPLVETGQPDDNRLAQDEVNQILLRAMPAEPENFRKQLQRGSVEYRLAYGPLQIRQSVVGVYSVALQSDFIFLRSANSRLVFAAIFSVMVIAVLVVGLSISRRLIMPILRLASTSQAVAAGDLSQRTGLNGGDEIGRLASTFDNMTQKLQERTRDLELLLQAHREEAFKTRAILSSIADGVLVLDPHGRIIMLNNAAERILGDMTSDFQAGLLREQPAQPSSEESMPLMVSEVRRFQINERTISAHAAPVITNDGQQLGTVIALRDITREAEIDRLKDSFIEQVSHELRTPLTAVKGYTDLMLQTAASQLPEKYLDFLSIINRHADSLIAMITELLDISQIEAGAMSLRLERIDLNELVEMTLEEWRERIAAKGLALEVVPDPHSASVTGDRRRLGWAIKQLVSNAVNYTEPGGRVQIGVSSDTDQAIVTVSDTGIGITSEDQKYIFTRFFRSTTRVHSNERGVGLGLYIVKAVAEAHRGKVEVRSAAGQGSTFRLCLPIREAADESPVVHMLQDRRT